MLKRIASYEWKTLFPKFLIWGSVSLLLAEVNRLGWLPIGDMPLVFLMIYSMIAIFLIRYYRSMHGREAVLTFSVPVSPFKLLLSRIIVIFSWSLIAVGMMGVAFILQGGDIGTLVLQASTPHKLLLLLALPVTLTMGMITFCAAVTLAHLPFCLKHRLLWCFAWYSGIWSITKALTATTDRLINHGIVLNAEGLQWLNDTSAPLQLSLTLSFNNMLWNAVMMLLCAGAIHYVIKKKLMVIY